MADPSRTLQRKSSKIFHPSSFKTLSFKEPSKNEKVSLKTTEMRQAAFKKAMEQNYSYFVKNELAETIQELDVEVSKGLSTTEANRRLEVNGRNELDKAPPTPLWRLFLAQFEDLLVILLIIACIISFVLGQYAAATTIVIIVLANAGLGFVQEVRSGQALDALQSLSQPEVKVLRDGKVDQIESALVVPGDVILLEMGDAVVADIRLIEAHSLTSREASHTGEPEPVKKSAVQAERKEGALTESHMVYMGCTIDSGNGRGVVVKTGMATKMGEVAKDISDADESDSPLQIKLQKLGVQLGIASIGISLVVFIVGVATGRGNDPNSTDPHVLQMLLVAVSLTVAAVPEGLPACVTITLAIGMRRMVEKKALIRNLHSVETLGSASVICTDKTGTLTAGAMTAVRLWCHGTITKITGAGYSPEGFYVTEQTESAKADANIADGVWQLPVLLGVLCSNAGLQYDPETSTWQAHGNTSERPLVVAGHKAGIKKVEVDKQYTRIKENPFDSTRKMMSTLVEIPKNSMPAFKKFDFVSCVKGAPNVILDVCTDIIDESGQSRPMTDKDRAELMEVIDAFSCRAYRVLAVAYQPFDDHPGDDGPEVLEKNLVLAGLFASIDPERQAVAPSIRKAAEAGIRTVMITGDYVKTAKAIAENIGLLPPGSPDAKAVDCSVIRALVEEARAAGSEDEKEKAAKKPNAQLAKVYARMDALTAYADVYARAKPADKMAIVRSLQRQGHVCSMTGDGVNDAPALKQANIGVAMGKTGTDVARAASDMVLTDDNFVSIVEAVEQGRTIYANIGKFVFFLLSTNVAEVFAILIAVLMGFPSPLVPVQILWLNLCTDGAPAIALAVEMTEYGTMDQGPRPLTEQLIEKVMITGVVIQTIVLTAVVLMAYMTGLYWQTGNWIWDDTWGTRELRGEAIKHGTTMTILVIVFAELLRAYTSRSLRNSIFTIGPFSNKWMQYSVFSALAATVAVTNIPGLMEVFGAVYLTTDEYILCVILIFVPVVIDELTKVIYRATDFGLRPKAVRPDAYREDAGLLEGTVSV